MWRLVEPNENYGEYDEYDMKPSKYAMLVKSTTDLKIITWTLNRTGPPLNKTGDWYWQTLQDQGVELTEGSRFDLVHVLYNEVGVEGIFDGKKSSCLNSRRLQFSAIFSRLACSDIVLCQLYGYQNPSQPLNVSTIDVVDVVQSRL